MLPSYIREISESLWEESGVEVERPTIRLSSQICIYVAVWGKERLTSASHLEVDRGRENSHGRDGF